MNNDFKKLTFVFGGAKSGKSGFALKLGNEISGKKVYLATATIQDEEMKIKVENHKTDRGLSWETIEEPVNVTNSILSFKNNCDVLLFDCITLWLSNLMMDESKDEADIFLEIKTFLGAVGEVNYSLIVVSNELGMGIVPVNDLARKFRNIAGKVNQMIAEKAGHVYWIAAGIPVKIK